jgi:hypothetical protein
MNTQGVIGTGAGGQRLLLRHVVAFGKLMGQSTQDLRGKHLALAADLHFIFPGALDGTVADGAIDEPTQVAAVELVSRALRLAVWRAGLDRPARHSGPSRGQTGDQKKKVSLDGRWNHAPALLIAVDGLE